MSDPRFSNYILRHKGLLRVIAFITLWSFFITSLPLDFVWAAGKPLKPSGVGFDRGSSPDLFKKLNIETFTLPQNLGHIQDSWSESGIAMPAASPSLRGRQSRPKQSQKKRLLRVLRTLAMTQKGTKTC